MAYDFLAESLTLLAHGVPDVPAALSRRRRFAPLAAATAGDVAATLFARRGVSGEVWLDLWTLTRDGGGDEWRFLGGGSANTGDDALADRPAAGPGRYAEPRGTARTLLGPERWLPWGARYAHTVHLRLSREVGTLRVDGRPQQVPRHGNLLVVWAGRRPPGVTAHAADGTELATVALVSR
jgi:hypothetical protein